MTVDSRDQTPYTRKRPDGPTAEGRFLGRTSAPGIDVLAGEARSPVYDAIHQRRITFVDGRYWVIEDRLQGEIEHEYDLRFHLAPGDAAIDGETVRADGLTLVIAGAGQIRLEPGWIAPEYGRRIEAPVVSARQWGRDAMFTTIVVPEP